MTEPTSDLQGDEFVSLRPMLFGVAYRMLGSVADAEDVVQDAFLKWQSAARDDVNNAEAFLTTVVVRTSLDLLRSARVRRETYVGPWLPEPLLVSEDEPAQAAELADSLSMAFLVLLEELSPAERAAFLLRDVFGYGYSDIARMLDREEPACRQLVTRAKRHVDARRQRFDADAGTAARLTQEFLLACGTGDVDGLIALMSPDVTIWSDGGGYAKAARRPVVGADKCARFLAGIAKSVAEDAAIDTCRINAQPGVVIREAGRTTTAMVLDIAGGQIVGVRLVVNPEKLHSA